MARVSASRWLCWETLIPLRLAAAASFWSGVISSSASLRFSMSL
jgi:hypothetical protein